MGTDTASFAILTQCPKKGNSKREPQTRLPFAKQFQLPR